MKPKFRARAKYHDRWVYGYLLGKHFIGEVVHDSEGFAAIISVTEIDPDTVGQFTGLIDKNGKEIYEGDLLTWEYNGGKKVKVRKVIWNAKLGGWHLDEAGFFAGLPRKYEVIGNIHENPELL